ncbi:substrate-binding domain-containing protein [Methanolobus sp. WCC5]|uniref:substrate-binding domain-containing protein n=1 Tax=Methanolobus sp. WCC5 TaxID=3125785 RepID=UPI003255DC00
MKIRRIINNEHAVSPIVATLILIVVAIAGAATVGTILGSFSGDVSDSTSSEDAARGASTQVLVAGSTTVGPVLDLMKDDFEKSSSGIALNVQGGGCGAGIAGVGMGVIDIAAISRELTPQEKTKYPDLETAWIGSSAVVMIGGSEITTWDGTTIGFTSPSTASSTTRMTPEQIKSIYSVSGGNIDDPAKLPDSSVAGQKVLRHLITKPNIKDGTGGSVADFSDLATNPITVYKRAESRSGTEYVFSELISGDGDFISTKGAVSVNGNAGMIEAIMNDPRGVGFVDYRYALEASKTGKINILAIDDGTCELRQKCVDDADHVKSHIKRALTTGNDDYTGYPAGLIRNMYLVTDGWPSSLEGRFINYAQQPGSMDKFDDAGYFSALGVA